MYKYLTKESNFFMSNGIKAKVFIIQQNPNSKYKMNVGFGTSLNLGNEYNGAVNDPLIDNNSIFVGGYVDKGKQMKNWTYVQNNNDNFNTRNGIFGRDKQGNFFLQDTNNQQLNNINSSNIDWAIQNGPILLEDGHNLCNQSSTSKNIRTGIGYNEKNELVVIATEEKVTPHEFAEMFKQQGCKNAIYLDGYPEKSTNAPVGYKFLVTDNTGNNYIEQDPMQQNRPLLQFFHSKITEKQIQ